MPSNVLALNVPIVLERPQTRIGIFKRLKERFQHILFAQSISNEEKLTSSIETIYKRINAQFQHDPEKREEIEQLHRDLKTHICKTTREMVERIVALERGYDYPKGRRLLRRREKAAIEEKITDIENAIHKGTHGFYHIFLNLEMIRKDHSGKEDRKACFVLTALHETLHHFGGFGRHKSFDDEYFVWLNEGITEQLAQQLLKEYHPRENEKLSFKDRVAYFDNRFALNLLGSIIGKRTIISAFLSNDFGIIENALKELGIEDKDIEEMLKLGERCGDSSKDWQNLMQHFDRMHRKARMRTDTEVRTEDWEDVFGKAGMEARRGIEQWKAMPREERTAAFAGTRAARLDILEEGIRRGEEMGKDEKFEKDCDYYEAKLGEFKAKYENAKTEDEVYALMDECGKIIDEMNAKYPDDKLFYALKLIINATSRWKDLAMTRVTGDPIWANTRH